MPKTFVLTAPVAKLTKVLPVLVIPAPPSSANGAASPSAIELGAPWVQAAAGGVGTLGAGVYFSASTMSITAGALTLDGGGNPAAVFIFQIGSALTMAAPGGNVILVNGANPCNIYWADFSGATLGGVATGAHFYGNLIAPTGALVFTTAITLFEGRALGGTPTAVNISAPTTGLSIINFGGD